MPSRPAALLALVLAVGLAGCGSTDAASTAAASASNDAATTSATAEAPDPDAFLDAVQAAMERAATVRISSDGTLLTGTGALDLETGDIRMSATIEGESLSILVVDGSAYLEDEASNTWQAVPDGLVDLGTLSPESSVADWRAGALALEVVGEEEVLGRPCTHYVLRVDPAAALDAKGADVPEGMPASVDYDVWVDDADLPARASFELMGESLSVDYTRWGDAVDIEAPPADRIVAWE